MSTEQKPLNGRAKFGELPFKEFAARLRDDLDRFASVYAVRVLAPSPLVADLDYALTARLGKRRAELLRVESDVQMLHRLRGDRERLTARRRRSVIDELAASAPTISEFVESGHSLDTLILNDPDHPYAHAYQAGLAALGVLHPYRDLDDVELPVDLRVLYVVSPAQLPRQVVSWAVRQQYDDLTVVLVSDDRPDAVAGDPVRVTQIRYSFDKPEQEHDALVTACMAGEIDTVFCANRAARALVEIECLLRRIPYSAPSMSSVIASETVDALVAYLEWTVYEEESGLETLLRKCGVATKTYRRFAKDHRLPGSLSVAALALSTRPPEESRPYEVVSALADLVFDSRVTASAAARLRYFARWGAERIPNFDPDLLEAISARSGIANDEISLADLKAALYDAISADPVRRITIASPSDEPIVATQRAWLALGTITPQAAEQLESAVNPCVLDTITVSTVATEAAP